VKVVVQNLLTNYHESGEGKLVLLLHGWGDNLRTFSSLQKDLSKEYKVVSLDLPGFGETQAPNEAWGLEDYAVFIGDFLKKLKLSQPYGAIGHSNGGAALIKAVATGNVKPDRLVLIAASGVRDTDSFKRFILKIIAKTGDVATIWMPERYRQGLRKSLYGVAGSDMMVVPELKETFKRTVREDLQEDATHITTDTLLIYSKGDRAVPISVATTYNSLIVNSKLETVDAAGHFIHQDQPEQTLRLIEGFLK
jgi:pimeloyl-ACP methyl ester carboxylesterase